MLDCKLFIILFFLFFFKFIFSFWDSRYLGFFFVLSFAILCIMQDLSSLSRNRTLNQGSNLCLLQWKCSLHHWTTREVPFFSFLKIFYWIIVNLQCCVSFKCIAKWFSYAYIYFFILFSIVGYYKILSIEFGVYHCYTFISSSFSLIHWLKFF